MANTTKLDVITSFESLPQSKYALPDLLVDQWLLDASGEYSAEISELNYDSATGEFDSKLPQYQIKTLAMIMYTYYLTRELSRAEKLNGIVTKDISITGSDASKRVTLADLELQLNKAKDMLNKQKTTAFT